MASIEQRVAAFAAESKKHVNHWQRCGDRAKDRDRLMDNKICTLIFK